MDAFFFLPFRKGDAGGISSGLSTGITVLGLTGHRHHAYVKPNNTVSTALAFVQQATLGETMIREDQGQPWTRCTTDLAYKQVGQSSGVVWTERWTWALIAYTILPTSLIIKLYGFCGRKAP